MNNQSTKTIPDEVEALYKQGWKYQNHRHYTSALDCYEKVITQIESIPQGNYDAHKLKCHVYLEMADCCTEEHKRLKAQKWISEAEKLAKQLQDEAKAAIRLDRRRNVKRLDGDCKGALKGFKDSPDLKLKPSRGENIDVNDSYDDNGVKYTNLGKYHVANISETNGVISSGFSDSVASGQFCNNDDNTNNRNNISSNNNEAPTSAPSTSSSNQMTPPVTGFDQDNKKIEDRSNIKQDIKNNLNETVYERMPKFKSKSVHDWMLNETEELASSSGLKEEEELISTSQAQQALTVYGEEFIRIVPVDEVLVPLKLKHVLSSREVEMINSRIHEEDKAHKLYDILFKNRHGNDLPVFCQLLKNSSVRGVQSFGKKLLKKAKNLSAESS
ncbi:uncharacterized protein TRIADDRAFT_62488 [Trichoplax adhaerens]|uniref:CARD domain-containing protein n=1 Tax=Trichoplax adhaerens TaxID=10228 RepID=B3SDY4_TRIAD|nr:predicted protein [Trichoplax adhaerens]EDV19063.1 predicted protein [Trichoplax adhaerens]|eukprot:XP_002118453.1 predicted protein [Trichoplax adhaerens]